MSRIEALSRGNAPEASRPLLDAVEKKLGTVPNLMSVLAHSPAALQSYLSQSEALGGGVLTAQERELISLATGQFNACAYCTAAHAMLGKKAGLTDEEIRDARLRKSEDEKRGAFLSFLDSVLRNRGFVEDAELENLLAAGYTKAHAVEITANIAMNVLTNYVNHVAETEVDFPPAPELETGSA